MGTTSLEQLEEEQAKNAPLYYECIECGREFAQATGRCIDVCGGKLNPVYPGDNWKKEDCDVAD